MWLMLSEDVHVGLEMLEATSTARERYGDGHSWLTFPRLGDQLWVSLALNNLKPTAL